jgi:hypothetical protein
MVGRSVWMEYGWEELHPISGGPMGGVKECILDVLRVLGRKMS